MRTQIGALLMVATCTAGCAAVPPPSPAAEATLEPRSGSNVFGSAAFSQSGQVVHAHVEVSGLAPGEHGFHLHENGDCSAMDGSSAGGHFNPAGAAHGRAGTGSHHAGDLPSLTANAAGKARADFDLPGLTLDAGPNSIVGRSLVVHRDHDDYTTQPAGASGPRVACGVIAAR